MRFSFECEGSNEDFTGRREKRKDEMKRYISLLILATLLMGVVLSFNPVLAADPDPAMTTSYTVASDNHTHVWGPNWSSENFTTDNFTESTVTSVQLKLTAVGTPAAGYFTVSIYKTSGGLPTGLPIATGNIQETVVSTSDWYSIPMATETTLELNTNYALVASAPNGTATNGIIWEKKTVGTYTGGMEAASANSGLTWAVVAPTTCDFLFQLWGKGTIIIQDVKAFQGYKTTGDWLIVVRYLNKFAPYFPSQNVKSYFAIQLVDNVTVLSSNSIPEWGNRIGSIYLAPAQVTGLDFGKAYKIRIQGLFTGSPYVDYTMVGSDWLGVDLTQLNSWCVSSASVMAEYDTTRTSITTVYTTSIATRGEVLNSAGGNILSAGISGLQTVRPEIFQIYTSNTQYTPATGTATFANTARAGTAAAIGPDAVIAFGRMGTNVMGGIPYNYVIAIVAIVLCFGLAAASFPFGHTTAANIICLGILFAFGYFGFDWIWIAMIYVVSIFLLAKKLWIDTGM